MVVVVAEVVVVVVAEVVVVVVAVVAVVVVTEVVVVVVTDVVVVVTVVVVVVVTVVKVDVVASVVETVLLLLSRATSKAVRPNRSRSSSRMNPTQQGDERPQQHLRRRRCFFSSPCLSGTVSFTEPRRSKRPLVEGFYRRSKPDRTIEDDDVRLTSDRKEYFLVIGEMIFDCEVISLSCSNDGS